MPPVFPRNGNAGFLLSAYQNGRNARTLQQKQGDFERLPQYLCEEIAWNSAATSGNSTLKREEKRRKRARTGQGFTSSMGVRPQRRRPQQSIRRRPCLRPFVRPIPPTRPFRADHFSPLPPRRHHMPHWAPVAFESAPLDRTSQHPLSRQAWAAETRSPHNTIEGISRRHEMRAR